MFKELTKEDIEAMKGGEHWITITQGMSGYFAVEMWLNNEDLPFPFPEPWNTGFGRYPNEQWAKDEALNMAKDLDLPFIFPKQRARA